MKETQFWHLLRSTHTHTPDTDRLSLDPISTLMSATSEADDGMAESFLYDPDWKAKRAQELVGNPLMAISWIFVALACVFQTRLPHLGSERSKLHSQGSFRLLFSTSDRLVYARNRRKQKSASLQRSRNNRKSWLVSTLPRRRNAVLALPPNASTCCGWGCAFECARVRPPPSKLLYQDFCPNVTLSHAHIHSHIHHHPLPHLPNTPTSHPLPHPSSHSPFRTSSHSCAEWPKRRRRPSTLQS
jgi:hypothetical protein